MSGSNKLLTNHFRSFIFLRAGAHDSCPANQNCASVMRTEQKLATAYICAAFLTVLRFVFIFVFFITSVICIVNAESRVERCKGQVILSQKTIDALDTTSTFVETAVSSFLIFLLYRWKLFNRSKIFSKLYQDRDSFGRGPCCGLLEFSRTFS